MKVLQVFGPPVAERKGEILNLNLNLNLVPRMGYCPVSSFIGALRCGPDI